MNRPHIKLTPGQAVDLLLAGNVVCGSWPNGKPTPYRWNKEYNKFDCFVSATNEWWSQPAPADFIFGAEWSIPLMIEDRPWVAVK